MTTKTVTSLLIATLLAGSAAAGLQVTDSVALAPVSSTPHPGTEPVTSQESVFLVLPAANKFAASPAGLKLAPPRVVLLTPRLSSPAD